MSACSTLTLCLFSRVQAVRGLLHRMSAETSHKFEQRPQLGLYQAFATETREIVDNKLEKPATIRFAPSFRLSQKGPEENENTQPVEGYAPELRYLALSMTPTSNWYTFICDIPVATFSFINPNCAVQISRIQEFRARLKV
ncbi:hypothetical protein C8R47DRAFT_1074257 [Mycena vitilis]|nr:hypothetical protein C8R47DRAFT_1074257 [Mycena vitilis]